MEEGVDRGGRRIKKKARGESNHSILYTCIELSKNMINCTDFFFKKEGRRPVEKLRFPWQSREVPAGWQWYPHCNGSVAFPKKREHMMSCPLFCPVCSSQTAMAVEWVL